MLRRNFASNDKVVSFESAIKIKDLGETNEISEVPPFPKRRDFRKMQSEENNVEEKNF